MDEAAVFGFPPGRDIAVDYANDTVTLTGIAACAGQICADANGDGTFDGADIDIFFFALGDPPAWDATYPDCDRVCVADVNGDDTVDGADIDAFFAALGDGKCP